MLHALVESGEHKSKELAKKDKEYDLLLAKNIELVMERENYLNQLVS